MTTDSPPGPAGYPLVGSLPGFAASPLNFLLDMRREYGTCTQFSIGGLTFWMFSDPADIEAVLLGKAKQMKKDHIYEKMGLLLGKGLVTSDGELWKKQRRIASKPVAKKQVDGYADQMRQISERYLARCTGERDVFEDMNRLTEEIVLEVLFGVPADSTTDQVGPAITTWMNQFQAEDSSILRIVPGWVPTPGRAEAARAVDTLDAILFRIIEEKRAQGGEGEDVLSRLLAAADADEGGMSNQQLRDEAVTLFTAGHETTALTLTWCLRQLALHPEWQDKLRHELRTLLPDGPHTAEDSTKLAITHAVIKEAMRLHPPAWAIGREPLEDVELAGRICPKGTQLILSQWVMHRDERWFPDPERFDPQRWLDGLEATLPRFAYFPFGGGPRVCIGNHFATMEAAIALAVLLRDHRVEPGAGLDTLELVPSVTLRPKHPIHLRWSPVP